jgi:hypothetical protein
MVLRQFTPGVHVFKAKGSILSEEGYFWHIVADDGQIVAQNYRPHATKIMALNSIRLLHDVFRFDFEGEYFDHSGTKVEVKKTWC